MILHWAVPEDPVNNIHVEPGKKLVGITIDRVRPNRVSFYREDIQYAIDHPKYLQHVLGAMR